MYHSLNKNENISIFLYLNRKWRERKNYKFGAVLCGVKNKEVIPLILFSCLLS